MVLPTDSAGGIYLGLGSNLGDRLKNLQVAVALMDQRAVRVLKGSSVYETAPVGPPQPKYLNAVCEVTTGLDPPDLLKALKEIETEIGREPGTRWGPRLIDLDILLYRDQVIHSDRLTVPHPELVNRPFVLIPLLEVAPDLGLPSGDEPASFLKLPDKGVVRRGPFPTLE